MKTQANTPSQMIKKLAKDIIASVNEYQAAEKAQRETRNAREWDYAQNTKGNAACDMMVNLQQMLSELGCVLSIEGIIGATDYYVIEKKNF